jgi:hypothetical protein
MEFRIADPAAVSLGVLLVLLFALARTGILFRLSNDFQTVLTQSSINSALLLLGISHLFLETAIVLTVAAIMGWFGLRSQNRARQASTVGP